jgi:hypothetical protein
MGSFVQAPGSPFGTASPESIAVGLFNDDEELDLAVTNFNAGTVSIFLGVGDGTFTAATGSPFGTGTNPRSVAVGDFNADSDLDLAVANFGSSSVSILLGDGMGSFAPAAGSPFAAGSQPSSVTVGLFDQDSVLDLAVTDFNNNGPGTVSIFLGNGNGTFDPAVPPTVNVGNGPVSIAVGLFDDDEELDLAVANLGSNTVSILLGNGMGSFAAATGSPFAAGSSPAYVAVGDFDEDSVLDLAVSNLVTPGTVSILLGNGDGTFGAPTSILTGGNQSRDVAVGDFNADLNLDLAVANNVTPGSVSILLGNGMGSFAAATGSPFLTGGDSPVGIAVGEFDNN